ncbi:MAG: 50S ribosome-binding GTPase [Elusimicrobiaceae bacterium]|nr:50S ribosome-binding GTPase [Elusimicrobiaceae bacterium]
MEPITSLTLFDLQPDITAEILSINVSPAQADKLAAMGLVKGQQVSRKKGKRPLVVCVCGSEIAIGPKIAKQIIVSTNTPTVLADRKYTFLLAGNPNVGKSLLFSRLTGIGILSSNFPGTTVGLHHGSTVFNGKSYHIIDIPGLYRLEEKWVIEGKKRDLFKELSYDFIVCVAETAHLERNLYFVLELLHLGKPVILLLNKFDEAQRKGIFIDVRMLSKMLGIPVIATVATTGEGLKRLEVTVGKLDLAKPFVWKGVQDLQGGLIPMEETPESKWHAIGQIIRRVQKIKHKHASWVEHLQAWATHPVSGLFIALAVLALSLVIIRFVGETFVNWLEPLYEAYYLPFVERMLAFWQGNPLYLFLVGDGGTQYFGVLTDGLKIALVDVMPYVLAFYALLGFWGELGYLPRLAVLLDGLLHRIGLHGYGAIPIMLGLGCKVPAVMGVRVLETRRERVIALALLLVVAPCISQTAMILSILSPYGWKYVLCVFGTLLINGIAAGTLLNRLLPGDTPEMFMEIPLWSLPQWRSLGRKIWLRMKEYLADALPLILAGVLFVDLMQFTGITDWLTQLFRYPVEYLLHLPADTTPLLLLGFLRKDISIALLEPFNLPPSQLVVACVFMSMYLPCIATFFVMLRENGIKDTLRVAALTISLAILSATVLRFII